MSNKTDMDTTTLNVHPPERGPRPAGDKGMVPTLLVVAGSHGVGRLIRIDREGTMMVGRAGDCGLWIDDESISRHHAEIRRDAAGVVLVDLHSRNGTFINGERIESRTLRDGDRIVLGSTTMMKFSYRDSLDEALQLHLYEAATRDGLTGAHNKRFFSETLEKEFRFASRHKSPLSILVIDIDHFKGVNDTHGHVVGDRVLAHVAAGIIKTLRSGDAFGRFGGDEFVQLLRECTLEDALKVGERLRQLVEALTFEDCGVAGLKVTISIGVASHLPGVHENAVALLESGDIQLYRAKQKGRNSICSALDE